LFERFKYDEGDSTNFDDILGASLPTIPNPLTRVRAGLLRRGGQGVPTDDPDGGGGEDPYGSSDVYGPSNSV
jgi:hypothetical protein